MVYLPITTQVVLIILILVAHPHVHDILTLALKYDLLVNLTAVVYVGIDNLIALCPQ